MKSSEVGVVGGGGGGGGGCGSGGDSEEVSSVRCQWCTLIKDVMIGR